MGQDPFGDKKEIPKGCYSQDTSTEATEIDDEITVDLAGRKESQKADKPEEGEQPEKVGEEEKAEAEAEARAEAKVKPASKAYNADGLMLKRLQTECRELITVAIYFLVDEELTTRLRRREADYRKSKDLRDSSPRGCMPWSEYKDIILACIGWS